MKTESGNLLVYGTIIGVLGNRRQSFRDDLVKQLADFSRITSQGRSLCIAGDFNCSFYDDYYFTSSGRESILQNFSENHIRLLTNQIPECIDHIAVTESFLNGSTFQAEEWNSDKTLSDHKGIAVRFAVK